MKRGLWKRFRFLWALSKIVPTRWSSVGNRQIEVGMVDKIEVTTILRDIRQPDWYSREELLHMLKTIRLNEELQGWQTPEPVKCIYCSHCSPTNDHGFCPAVTFPKASIGNPHQIKCDCSNHIAGLKEGSRLAIDSAMRRVFS